MKRILLFFLVVLAGVYAFRTPVVPPAGFEFKLVEIPSPSLENALISPSKTYKIGVNLPPSYYSSEERYPVVYFLHGYTVYPGQYPSTYSIDHAYGKSAIKDMIIVDISGYNLFKGTMYTNSPVTGNWEDFVTEDIVNYVDQNYRTIPERESRGIVGHSMGGAGCVNISLRHPDKYAVAYPMSPAIAESGDAVMELMFPNDSTMMYLDDLSGKIAGAGKNDFQKELIKVLDTSLNNKWLWVLGYGMAFSPDLSKPLKTGLPYDRQEDGSYKVNEENYAKWANGFGDLDQKVQTYKPGLLQYENYTMDCGQNDELRFIVKGTRRFAQLLSDNEVPYSIQWYDGDHTNKVGEQLSNRVFPLMSIYLKREEVAK